LEELEAQSLHIFFHEESMLTEYLLRQVIHKMDIRQYVQSVCIFKTIALHFQEEQKHKYMQKVLVIGVAIGVAIGMFETTASPRVLS